MDLPDECWELIFNSLGHLYYLDGISLVSKRFLSISNGLRHTLTISDCRIHRDFDISKLFCRFTQLRRIVISSPMPHEDLDRIVVEIARSGLNLEELSFGDESEIPVEGLKELGPNLKTLRFNSCHLSGSDLIAIARSLPKLQKLDVGVFLWRKEILKEVLEFGSKLKYPRKIKLIYRGLGVQDRAHLALSSNRALLSEVASVNLRVDQHTAGSALRYCSNLNSLSVDYYYLSNPPSNMFTIENSISYARALCALELSYLDISDTTLCSIAQAHLPLEKLKLICCSKITVFGLSLLLREYQSISELSLKASAILTDQNLNHLSKFLSKVAKIDLSYCSQLTNSTIFILARSCPLLVDINMTRTSLGQDDDAHVDLKRNSQVQFLTLSFNKSLNDESLKRIGYVCPNLLKLDISYCWNSPSSSCDITEDGIGEILKSCSGIRHFQVSGCKLQMILGKGSEHSKLNIEELEVSGSEINDKGMAMIGMRCPRLLKLQLRRCLEVTAEGVKEVVEKCPKLMEINWTGCHNVGVDVLSWIQLTRPPSLRKIIAPRQYSISEDEINLFMRLGCRYCNETIPYTRSSERDSDYL